jgi:hypothetical protein
MGNSVNDSSLLLRSPSLLRTLQDRYEEVELRTKFRVWQSIRAWSLDAMRDLRDFHDAMRDRLPVLRCAECVSEAMMKSEGRALTIARQELAGLDLTMIWPMLWMIAKDVGIYIGGGIVLGGTVGGVIGAFFGGAGAIPGAIGGGAVGAEIGSWLLGLIGIKCLVEHIGKAVPEMAEQYSRGFAFAWHAGELDFRWTLKVGRRMQSATESFARGHLLLVVAILSAIVLYLSRGALGKAKLYAELGQSKLGPKFAKWVEENEGKLVKHPALQPQKPVAAAMMEGEGPPTSRAKPTAKKAPENRAADSNSTAPRSSAADTGVPIGVPLSRERAGEFYRELGWKENRIQSHLDGIDFSKPVSVEVLPEGTVVEQWVDPRRGVGNYFANSGTSASELGIYEGERVSRKFVVTADTPVLKSTAGSITDTWTAPPAAFPTRGGGTQYFTKQPENFVQLEP